MLGTAHLANAIRSSQPVSARRELFGHPKGLTFLFTTEMWERFSYYGMRSLLVLYMTKYLLAPEHARNVLGLGGVKSALEAVFGPLDVQPLSSQIYGFYTALVYLTPIFGGILADRVLGQRRTVVLGAVLMAIGHFMMAFQSVFFPALLFLILGNGAFKPNISTQVGSLYPAGDPRRDRAFSIFYVGINLGAFFSPLVCGTLGEVYGWHYGFSAAGIGMVIGLLIYLSGQRWLAPDNLMERELAGENALPSITTEEKNRMWGLIAVCLISVAFWAAYEQQGNTLALWADTNTDRLIFGWEFPASWYQSLNPALVFLLTPVITTLWAWQSKKQREPSAVTKMAFGCFLLASGFLVMVPAAMSYAADGTPVSVLWLFFFTLLVTLGEL